MMVSPSIRAGLVPFSAMLLALLGLASCGDEDLSAGGSSTEISATEDIDAPDSDTPPVDEAVGTAAVVAGSESGVEDEAGAGATAEEVANKPAGDGATQGTTEGTVVLAADEPMSENAAEPPPLATEPENDVDDEETVDPLDPGSALACAALEIGRDGALDGDFTHAVALAGRVDHDAVGDGTIKSIVADVASSEQADLKALARGIERCESLGYETAS